MGRWRIGSGLDAQPEGGARIRGFAQSVGLVAILLVPPADALASGESIALDPVDVPPGATVTITFEVTVDDPLGVCASSVVNQGTVSGSNFGPVVTDDPDVGGAADPTITSLDVADLSITKTDGQATAIPGGPLGYTITVANAGPGNALGATVTDSFPAALVGVTWTCAASPGSSCTVGPAAGDISDSVTLLAGGTLTYTATGTIDPGATGALSNTATVLAPPGTTDCATANNSATDTDTLTPQADLSITKSDGQASAVPGTPITYTIVVTNGGPSHAAAATVSDTFPATLTGVAWTCAASAGSTCTAGPVAGDIADSVSLLVGGTLTYTAMATIDPGATGSLTNTATVASAIDPAAGNNSATDVDALTPTADLSITKDDVADPPGAGENVVYTLTVENLGPSTATGVAVTDNLPAGLTLVATSGCAEDPNGTPTCSLGAIAASGSAMYTIEASVDPMPPASVVNTATVAGNEPDPVPGNDSDSETTSFDVTPPEVEGIDTVAGTGDGVLEECETARAPISRFQIAFSEDVAHASPADPESVTNPANYRLVAPTLGSGFDTTSCAGGTGADTVVPVDGVSYDEGTWTATVDVGAGSLLADRQHRLLVCGTIEDLAGNLLDGGAGAGSDLRRDFRMDRMNLFDNGHFDCDLGGWASSDPPGVAWSGIDYDGSPTTGSATNVNPLGSFDVSQCVPVHAATLYDLGVGLRLDAAPGDFFQADVSCTSYSLAGCAGAALGTQSFPALVGATGGSWLSFALATTTPSGALSARCRFTVTTPFGDAYDAYLDELFLGRRVIFADSFESGDVSAWAMTVTP